MRCIAVLLAVMLGVMPGLLYAQDAKQAEAEPVEQQSEETSAPAEQEAPAVAEEPAKEAPVAAEEAKPEAPIEAKAPVEVPAPTEEAAKPKEPVAEEKPKAETAPKPKIGAAIMEPDLPDDLLGVQKGIINERLIVGVRDQYELTPASKYTKAAEQAKRETSGCPSEACDGKLRAALQVDRFFYLEATLDKVTLNMKLTLRRSAGNLEATAVCENCTAPELESRVDELLAGLMDKDEKLPPQPEVMAKALPDEKEPVEDKPGFRLPVWGWALAAGGALVLLSALAGGGGGGKKKDESGSIEFTW